MTWTKEQIQCISPKNGIHNVIVSAGAGAGKTATLVERIIRSVTEEKLNIGINEILCVTFTRDAAKEMKDRIAVALENMIRVNPNNVRLKRQLSMMETASIMTIDSFCLKLIKDYISDTDIDPAFRIADSAELAVIWDKTMTRYLEEQYAKREEEFLAFADAYSNAKHDWGIRDNIKAVYNVAQSNPFPISWIEHCRQNLYCDGANIEGQGWLQFLLNDMRMQMESLLENLIDALDVCNQERGPYFYREMIESDKRQLEELLNCMNYRDISARLSNLEFMRMASKKDLKINEAKKAYVSTVRKGEKKALQEMQKRYALKESDLEKVLSEMRPHMLMLLRLTKGMIGAYELAKKEKNILDFSDIEHKALQLLVKEDGTYTHLADTVANEFKQIYVDEYQDVNMLQDTIIQSVSGERFSKPNVFMVGDVKQSIYKFRLARPELFLSKYSTYSENDTEKNQKVELHRNFRSRKQVIETINFFFKQLMTPAFGNISYDKKTALNHGALYPNTNNVKAKNTTLYLIENSEITSDELVCREKEAMVISDSIKSIVAKESVYDKDLGTYRMATYKDIVVLTRTFSGWAEDICSLLDKEGIPNFADKTVGFLDTIEVQAVLAVLQVADNPMQDIPLLSAMMQVYDFTILDMTDIVGTSKGNTNCTGLYSQLLNYINANAGHNEKLKEKLIDFLNFISKINSECRDYSIYELINLIYNQTGYYAKVSALPNGEIKQKNLEMLLNQAEQYSNIDNGVTGIFQFTHRMDDLKKYQENITESVNMEKDAVRITTIHKSKGREFPIVILAGIGKRFNQQDMRKSVLVHQELGVVSDYINPKEKTKKLTLAKRAVARKIQIETLEEELRILYVAMTRAKERLIMVGSEKNILDKLQKCAHISRKKDVALPYLELTQATSFMDWIFMGIARNRIYEPFMSIQGLKMDTTNPLYNEKANLELKIVDVNDLLLKHSKFKQEIKGTKEMVEAALLSGENKINSNIRYAYQKIAELKPKALLDDIMEQKKRRVVTKSVILPEFMKQKTVTGADKGTIYHKILQHIDFSKCQTKDGIEGEIDRLIKDNILSAEMLSTIKISFIMKFFDSEFGRRMVAASNTIKKEIYYMEAVPATLVNPEISDNTTVIMQGVIDAYFADKDGYILVDYKSDNVRSGRESAAAKKHMEQINRYCNAMQKGGKHVKEAYIIFLQTGKAIQVV